MFSELSGKYADFVLLFFLTIVISLPVLILCSFGYCFSWETKVHVVIFSYFLFSFYKKSFLYLNKTQ